MMKVGAVAPGCSGKISEPYILESCCPFVDNSDPPGGSFSRRLFPLLKNDRKPIWRVLYKLDSPIYRPTLVREEEFKGRLASKTAKF